MNKNALTEQRRESVIGLLKNMNIRKDSEGGFDKDDVYECMQQLCDLYENNIEELENAYEGEINELRERYQKYDDNNELYVSLIMEAKKSSNDIINQAKSEVENILAEGRDQVARQEKELEQMRNGMESEKEAITKELNASREAVEAEKAAMKAEVQAEKEKAEALKNKYRQIINSMEEEFAEIKTNILRTAGRIDSLKSKLADDEAAPWTVDDVPADVEFPAVDEGIEEIVLPDVNAIGAGVETAAAEPAVETVQEEGGLKLEDLMPEHAAGAETLQAEAPAEELKLDDIEIELPELSEEPAAEKAEAAQEAAQTEAKNDGEDSGEISFEGLEELFKDEK